MTSSPRTDLGILPRELVSRVEWWTLMYQQSDGSWFEVDRSRRTAVLKYALEDKAESERNYPNDTYRLAIVSVVTEFPSLEELS